MQFDELSKEDKEFIDMTHRNTELLEENQQLKEKYVNAVADYEIEKSKNVEALKFVEDVEIYVERMTNDVKNDLLQILKGDEEND